MSPFVDPDLSLTDAERNKFNQAVTIAGLDPEQSWNHVIALGTSGALLPGFVTAVPVASLSELKQRAGISDSVLQSAGIGNVHLSAPAVATDNPQYAALAPRDLAATLTLQQHHDLKRAAGTYMFGDSTNVADDGSLVDVLHFPTTLNIIAAQSLTLAEGVVLTLEGSPWLLILGSLHIASGAQIASSADTIVNVQVAYSAN